MAKLCIGDVMFLGMATQCAMRPESVLDNDDAKYHVPIANPSARLSQYRPIMLKPIALTHNSARVINI